MRVALTGATGFIGSHTWLSFKRTELRSGSYRNGKEK
jgi:hypothetical protein